MGMASVASPSIDLAVHNSVPEKDHVMLNISNIPTTHGTQHILIEASIAQGNAEHYYTELCYKSIASVLQKQAVGG